MTAAAPAELAVAERVLRHHRRTLSQLATAHERRLQTGLRHGMQILDRVDAALAAGDPAAVRRLLEQERAQLAARPAGFDLADGWDITALAWTHWALERIARALRGVTIPDDLGLGPGEERGTA